MNDDYKKRLTNFGLLMDMFNEEEQEEIMREAEERKSAENHSPSTNASYHEYLVEMFSELEEDTEDTESVIEMINNDEWEEGDGVEEAFIKSVQKSKFPEMLGDYTAQDLKEMKVYKVKGLDAGFVIKDFDGFRNESGAKDAEVILVHNNSGVGGLGKPLMQASVDKGAKYLDHFGLPREGNPNREKVEGAPASKQGMNPDFLSALYEKFGFKEYYRDHYNSKYDEDGKFVGKYGPMDVIYRKR